MVPLFFRSDITMQRSRSRSRGSRTSSRGKSRHSRTSKPRSRSKSQSDNKERPSPNESATLFKPGTVKQGNDGEQWVVAQHGGVKRWRRHVKSKNGVTVMGDRLVSIDIGQVAPPKEMTTIEITRGKIGLGEIVYNIFSARVGVYTCYSFRGCLLVVHESDKSRLKSRDKSLVFKREIGTAQCDAGQFMVCDPARMEVGKKGPFGYKFPYDKLDLNRKFKQRRDWFAVEADEIIDGVDEPDEEGPVAIFAGNMHGDGIFPILKCGASYLIVSVRVFDKM
jgi:hypothetical protein